MQAEIVKVPYDREGRYPDWDTDAIIVKPSTLTEVTFIDSLINRAENGKSVKLFTQESYNKYIADCEESKKRLQEEESQEESVEESGEEKF